MLFLLLTGCAYTVHTLAQVSPGGGGGEFYALVRTDYFGSPGHLRASDATLIRCAYEAAPRETTCAPVLTSEEAFSVVDANKPTTFSRTGGVPDPANSDAYGSAVALARSLISVREALIVKEGMTAEQAATVRAQAKREACAMIATVTDRRCDEVLFLAPP